VELDPRVRAADSTIAGQLELALGIWRAMAEQQVVHRGLESLERQLRSPRTLDHAARTRIGALEGAVDTLAPAVRSVGAELAALETVVQSADRAPTEQARAVFVELRNRLSVAARRWQRVLASDLPALNVLLQRSGVPALQVPAQARDSIGAP
jgi:hypothetical protein